MLIHLQAWVFPQLGCCPSDGLNRLDSRIVYLRTAVHVTGCPGILIFLFYSSAATLAIVIVLFPASRQASKSAPTADDSVFYETLLCMSSTWVNSFKLPFGLIGTPHCLDKYCFVFLPSSPQHPTAHSDSHAWLSHPHTDTPRPQPI